MAVILNKIPHFLLKLVLQYYQLGWGWGDLFRGILAKCIFPVIHFWGLIVCYSVLYGNKITELPKGLFEGLFSLQLL